ncbi:hypothetical protein GH860_30150 [Bacillus thuringiensis]|nr:hypothetical protein [Bacillus thuringiensis]
MRMEFIATVSMYPWSGVIFDTTVFASNALEATEQLEKEGYVVYEVKSVEDED